MFEFELALDTLDDVPQNFQSLYAKGDDGKFKMDTALASKLDNSGLKSALEKERKSNKTATQQLESWKKLNFGATPEEVTAKFQELQEAATKGADGKVNWDKMKADLETGHSKVIKTKEDEVKSMRGTLEKHLVENVVITALTEAKGSPALLLPHVKSHLRVFENNGDYVVRVVDADGDMRGGGTGKDGYMTIKDLISEMKTSKEFSRAFEAEGTTGGGKPTGGSKNGKDGRAGRDAKDLSPNDKIRIGLEKGQLKS